MGAANIVLEQIKRQDMRLNPMEILQDIIIILQCVTLVGAVVGLIITVVKTANKPNKTQDERLDALEEWQVKVNIRLKMGNDHFGQIDEANTVTQGSLLAIMDALISGDNKEELQKQRTELYHYLTSRKGEKNAD